MIGKMDQKGFSAVGSLSSDRLLDDIGENLRLLSLLLAPPGRDFLRLLRNDSELPGGGEWSAHYQDDGKLLACLQVEHTRLFVTCFPRLAAPP